MKRVRAQFQRRRYCRAVLSNEVKTADQIGLIWPQSTEKRLDAGAGCPGLLLLGSTEIRQAGKGMGIFDSLAPAP